MTNKNDRWLWAFMSLLPAFAWFVVSWRVADAVPFLEFVDATWSFPFVATILDNVWYTAFGSTLPIAGFVSYLVAVELAHCMFIVLVYIPRFAKKLLTFFARSKGVD